MLFTENTPQSHISYESRTLLLPSPFPVRHSVSVFFSVKTLSCGSTLLPAISFPVTRSTAPISISIATASKNSKVLCAISLETGATADIPKELARNLHRSTYLYLHRNSARRLELLDCDFSNRRRQEIFPEGKAI